MHVTSVRSMRLVGPDPLGYTSNGTRSVLLVRIDTDAGLSGIGEGADWPGVRELLDRYGRWLIGRDPLQIIEFTQTMLYGGLPPANPEQSATVLHAGPVTWAVSAIEIALHDIAGKALGVPVHVLLGGKLRDRIRLYLHCVSAGSSPAGDKGAWVQAARAGVEMGFDFFKFDVEQAAPDETRDTRNRHLGPAQISAIGERFELVRDAVGAACDIAADGHMHYDVPTAIAISRALAPSALTWLEDPIPPYSPDALAKVRNASPVPICAGEMFAAEEIRTLIEHSSCDFVNLDLLTVGGVRRSRSVVDMAHLFYLPAAIHHNWSMVGAVAASHVAAASANFVAMEMFQGYLGSELMMGLVRESVELMGPGHMRVPTSPGLGISLDEELCRKFLAPAEELL